MAPTHHSPPPSLISRGSSSMDEPPPSIDLAAQAGERLRALIVEGRPEDEERGSW